MAQDWQDRVYVKPSSIQGLGVFARRTFATGEPILVREERPVTHDQPLDAARSELEYHCDWLEGGRQVYLGFPERHFNHSCDANAFVRFEDGIATVVALRAIRPNEEITNNYSLNLWDGDPWVCNCGSEHCSADRPRQLLRAAPRASDRAQPSARTLVRPRAQGRIRPLPTTRRPRGPHRSLRRRKRVRGKPLAPPVVSGAGPIKKTRSARSGRPR